MIESVLGPILALLIVFWGLWIMLSSFLPSSGGFRSGPAGGGFGGRLMAGCLFSVLLPVVWFSIALVGRIYHRSFVVSTEFVSGVHDWPTYRTSMFKYMGAVFAFVGFNALILFPFTFLVLLENPEYGANPQDAWMAPLIFGLTALLSLLAARTFLRRMP